MLSPVAGLSGGRPSHTAGELIAAVESYLAWAEAGGLSSSADADVLEEAVALETVRRRLGAAEVHVVAELDHRAIGSRVGARSTVGLLAGRLRLSPFEAKCRVLASQALGPRRSLAGELLAPLVPGLAAAQRAGEVSSEHIRLTLAALDRVPPTLGAAAAGEAARILTEVARHGSPREVSLAGERLLDTLDPDGLEPRAEELDRRRSLTMSPARDGSWRLHGELTPTCGALLHAFLDSRAAPRPSDESGPDARTHAQRMHDALELGAGVLARHRGPQDSGPPATVIITMTSAQLGRHSELGSPSPGLAATGAGQHLGMPAALSLADEAVIAAVFRDATGAVLDLHRTRRLATLNQTLALIARDRGCSFPGCDAPATWTQRHHVVPWHQGGTTNLANLTLVCHYHHREFPRRGWACHMVEGLPAWVPPAWIDPARVPRYNARIRHP